MAFKNMLGVKSQQLAPCKSNGVSGVCQEVRGAYLNIPASPCATLAVFGPYGFRHSPGHGICRSSLAVLPSCATWCRVSSQRWETFVLNQLLHERIDCCFAD